MIWDKGQSQHQQPTTAHNNIIKVVQEITQRYDAHRVHSYGKQSCFSSVTVKPKSSTEITKIRVNLKTVIFLKNIQQPIGGFIIRWHEESTSLCLHVNVHVKVTIPYNMRKCISMPTCQVCMPTIMQHSDKTIWILSEYQSAQSSQSLIPHSHSNLTVSQSSQSLSVLIIAWHSYSHSVGTCAHCQ